MSPDARLDKTYTSVLGGYSIDYPSDWSVKPAPGPWTSGYDTQTPSDTIGNSPTIYGTSRKLPAGMSFVTWFAAYDAHRTASTCAATSFNDTITIDGALGYLDVHCSSHYLEAVVPKGGRAYVFTMFTPYTRPMFESFLATIRLDPASAKN